MSDVAPFDVDAVRQWAELPHPAAGEEADRLWRQLRADVLAACDAIEERDVVLARQAAELVGLRRAG